MHCVCGRVCRSEAIVLELMLSFHLSVGSGKWVHAVGVVEQGFHLSVGSGKWVHAVRIVQQAPYQLHHFPNSHNIVF